MYCLFNILLKMACELWKTYLVALTEWFCKWKNTEPCKIIQVNFRAWCFLLLCCVFLWSFTFCSSWCFLFRCLFFNWFHRWWSHGSKKRVKIIREWERKRVIYIGEGHEIQFPLRKRFHQYALSSHRCLDIREKIFLRNLHFTIWHIKVLLIWYFLIEFY